MPNGPMAGYPLPAFACTVTIVWQRCPSHAAPRASCAPSKCRG